MNIRGSNYTIFKLYLVTSLLSVFTSEGISNAQDKPGDEKRVSFTEIWQLFKNNSPSQKAAMYDEKAAVIQKDRQARHWFPRVYADVRGYATNDAGLVFMSNMGQRGVKSVDFDPALLNNPGTSLYSRGVIGIDLPVYEGGAGVETSKSMDSIAEARRFQRASIYLNEYSTVVSAYGRIIVMMKNVKDLKDLERSVDSVLENYQWGLKSNPVEYSGILGLRALKNRITAIRDRNESMLVSIKGYLDKMSGDSLRGGWLPADDDGVIFSETALGTGINDRSSVSFNTRAYEAMADAAKSSAEAEKSIFLPRIGLYSEASIYRGDRDTADAYTAGFYIKMNLVSPTDYGAVKQAEFRSEAAKSRAREARLKEDTELSKLKGMAETLKRNIRILRESETLMDEQVKNTRRLYASGAVKSFQVADVLSRKADQIINLSETQEEYINTIAGIYSISATEAEVVKNEK